MHINVDKLQRVNVVGTSGSGKSTIARLLAEKLNHPYVQMDELFWEPNWMQPTEEVFFERLRTALRPGAWVLDGNYDRTLAIKWADVQTVIWIDYSFTRTLLQAIRRAVQRSLSGEELWKGTGNRESFRKSFLSRDSIIIWTLKTYFKNRERYNSRFARPEYAHIQFVVLKSPSEARQFLSELKL